MIQTIVSLIKAFVFLLQLWVEKNKEKSDKKAAIGAEIVEAFKETDKVKRAAKLKLVVDNINRL